MPILFILNSVVIASIGIGLIMPIMPDLILEIEAVVWSGILSTVFAVMRFLFRTLLGRLSDRYVRCWVGAPFLLSSFSDGRGRVGASGRPDAARACGAIATARRRILTCSRPRRVVKLIATDRQ